MSDLQLVLIILGALIIATVVVYNWLQERKLRKNITDDFIVPQKDVLAEDFYLDADAYVDKEMADSPQKSRLTERLNEAKTETKASPSLQPEIISKEIEADDVSAQEHTNNAATEAKQPLQSQVINSDKAEIVERTLHTDFSPPSAPQPLPVLAINESSANTVAGKETQNSASPLPADIHPQIDLTAFLFATKNISTKTLITMAEAITSDMGVPMMLHGADADGKWHVVNQLATESAYKQIACSIQLADRGGPISKHMLNKFQFSIENMGLELSSHVEWQGSGDAMQRAIELDKFCMEVDQLVSAHIVQSDAPAHGTKFRGLAEANGLRLSDDGKFYCYASSAPDVPQFSLINTDTQPFTSERLRNAVVMGATFQLEIPKVAHCDQVFNQMIQIAQKMANSLGARLVDDNQKPLGDLQIEKIRQQLKVIHATMVARGILPGSPSSMRLFN